jgi:hypothetical protein
MHERLARNLLSAQCYAQSVALAISPPIWGSRGREFKSRQPDRSMSDYHA